MNIVYHIGMHCTDEDQALRCLLRNADRLAAEGTAVPLPATFKPVLREAMLALRGKPADADLEARLLAAVLADRPDQPPPRRILFSNDNFLCPPVRAVAGAQLYPLAGERLPWIRNLFPDRPAVFAFAVRNPATLLPALHARGARETALADFLARTEPDALSWAEAVGRMRAAVPDAAFLIWCNEDSALIWPDILGALSGAAEPARLDGADEFLSRIMTEAGMARMRDYLGSHPVRTPEHRRRVTAAFLDKFARAEAVEVELEAPGFTPERVARITARYEADVARLREMPGVTVLAP